ncbi:MAG: hypothetical protein WCX73_00165 [Candidatus Pacearchaeota archaeon]|jgi:hypothetical protein
MKQQQNMKKLLLIVIGFLILNINFVLAEDSTFSGRTYTSTFSGDNIQVVGSSVNPQFNDPSFYSVSGFTSTSDYWPGFEESDCYAREDFIMQIAPGGCSPAVVRSDLLEEQNVPVFCKVMAIKTNPLIDVSKIKSLHFDKEYPEGVSSISYFPARAALSSTSQLVSSPIEDNLGYLVIVLKQTDAERDMPDYVEGNVTATIDYDAEGAFGIGNTNFYASEMTDEEWARNYQEYGFWNGKGYIRAESIESDRATLSIYRDLGEKETTVTLMEGETSSDIYLSGFYCAAGMTIKIDSISAPVKSALLQIDDEQVWVSKGDYFLNRKCRVSDLDVSQGGGTIDITCSGAGKFSLSLTAGKAKLITGGESNEVSKEYSVGEKISGGEDNIWLGYVGQDSQKQDFIVLVKDEFSTSESEFADKDVYSIVGDIISKSDQGISKLKDDIEKKIKSQYKTKLGNRVSSSALDKGLDVSIIQQGSNEAVFGIKLQESLVIKDKDWSSESSETLLLAKDYYDKAVENYQDLSDFYPNEKRIDETSEDSYAAQGLYEAAILAKKFDMNEQANEFYTRLLQDYPTSSIANQVLREKSVLTKYDSTESKAIVNLNNGQYFISLLSFKTPTRAEANAVLMINGKEETLGLGDIYELESDGKRIGTIQVKELKDEQVTLKYDKSAVISEKLSSSLTASEILKTTEGENQVVFGETAVKLMKINLENQVKISINPKSYGPRTNSSFGFKIGIEKRAIELSPEKTQEMIDDLDNQLEDWTEINDKLGEVVKGLKTACFATSAIFTVKNLFSGLSGESMARNAVMTGTNGWNDKCQAMVEGKTPGKNGQIYSSVQQCLLDYGTEISQSVTDYTTAVKDINTKLESIQESVGINKSGILGLDASVDSEKVKTQFCQQYFKSYYASHLNDEFALSDGRKVKLKEIIPQEKVDSCDVSLSNMRDLYASGQLASGSVSQAVLNGDLSKNLLYTYESNQNDYNYDVLAKEAGQFVGEKPQALVLSGDNIAYTSMNTLTNAQAEEWNQKGATGIKAGDKVITYRVPNGATFYTEGESNSKKENLLSDLNGKTVLIVLEKEGTGNTYGAKEAYEIDGDKLIKIDKSTSPLFAYLDEKGATKFIEADPKAYQNKISNPSSLSVKYFETEPYAGLPAEVPFDVENGWYVELTYVLSGFGKPYDDSGRAVNYYVCNVGENGKIEFKKSADDICRYYTGDVDSIDFPGMSSADSKKLLNKAQDALAQAAKQSGKTTISINGQTYKGGISLSGEEGSCSDFMSPEDCQILFNLCDPVICPSSRCDLGGTYRVDNVIQSGIIGSLVLCLPNLKEGIMIPICLTGVHAGIEGYISILNSTQQCLQESLETGANVGICDEIKSVYLCEFFWREASPFLNMLVPKLLESFYSQGARGGGEYLTVQAAWENTQSSIDYFKNDYAVNSMNAFTSRSTEEIGTDICKSFMSVNVVSDLDNLIEPDSPEQYSAWFSEDELTSATIPATSQYKVYYHIYSGKDQGTSYVVYLTDLPESNYVHSSGTYVVARGYIAKGGSVDEAKDFSAVSGYKKLCVSVNGQDKCGFGKVSTSYFVNALTDEYTAEQASQTGIISEETCVAGTSSVLSLVQPNLEEGVDDTINSELYNNGIIRVCSTYNPRKQVSSSGEYDTTNSTYDRWKNVGYCDDPTIICWLDTNSVADVITNTGIEESVLNNISINNLGEGYWDQNKSDTEANKAQKFIDDLETKEIKNLGTEEAIDYKIKDTVTILNKLSNLGISNRYRARGLFLLGRLYNKISVSLKPTTSLESVTTTVVEESDCAENNGVIKTSCSSGCSIAGVSLSEGDVCCDIDCEADALIKTETGLNFGELKDTQNLIKGEVEYDILTIKEKDSENLQILLKNLADIEDKPIITVKKTERLSNLGYSLKE